MEKTSLEKYDFTSYLTYNDQRLKSSTPSIIKYNNKYIMNLRYINYKIDETGKYLFIDNNLPTSPENGKLVTINKYIKLNQLFEIEEEYLIESSFKDNLQYKAYEDLRLFKLKDCIYFTCTGQDSIDMKIKVGHGIYKENKIIAQYFSSPFNRNCEKNWCMFEHNNKIKFIYEWYPLQIGEIDSNDEFKITTTIQTPLYFQYIKGSTPGFVYGDEIWFVGHLVAYHKELPREYYHCIIILDKKTLDIKKYSKPFYFSENTRNTVEYCLGLVVEKKTIIFSYSVMDSQSFVEVYDKKKLSEQIF